MATAAVPTLLNLLEPASLLRHFHDHPPEGFSPVPVEGGVPAFSMDFDLLTTLEPAARRRVGALPLARWWQRFLVRSTCFIGTTVSEYARCRPRRSSDCECAPHGWRWCGKACRGGNALGSACHPKVHPERGWRGGGGGEGRLKIGGKGGGGGEKGIGAAGCGGRPGPPPLSRRERDGVRGCVTPLDAKHRPEPANNSPQGKRTKSGSRGAD